MFYQNSNDLVKHASVLSGHVQNSHATRDVLLKQSSPSPSPSPSPAAVNIGSTYDNNPAQSTQSTQSTQSMSTDNSLSIGAKFQNMIQSLIDTVSLKEGLTENGDQTQYVNDMADDARKYSAQEIAYNQKLIKTMDFLDQKNPTNPRVTWAEVSDSAGNTKYGYITKDGIFQIWHAPRTPSNNWLQTDKMKTNTSVIGCPRPETMKKMKIAGTWDSIKHYDMVYSESDAGRKNPLFMLVNPNVRDPMNSHDRKGLFSCGNERGIVYVTERPSADFDMSNTTKNGCYTIRTDSKGGSFDFTEQRDLGDASISQCKRRAEDMGSSHFLIAPSVNQNQPNQGACLVYTGNGDPSTDINNYLKFDETGAACHQVNNQEEDEDGFMKAYSTASLPRMYGKKPDASKQLSAGVYALKSGGPAGVNKGDIGKLAYINHNGEKHEYPPSALSYTSPTSYITLDGYDTRSTESSYGLKEAKKRNKFPLLANMPNWELIIQFRLDGGRRRYRALVGNMYNDTIKRGWGVWVSPSNGIHWSWKYSTIDFDLNVENNIHYQLTITNSPTTLSMVLKNMSNNGPKRVEISNMYGPWIKDDRATEIKFLNDGQHVYMFYEEPYTKMVSEDNEEKYYLGNIAKFNPSDWDSYSSTGGGKYLLRKTGQYKEISRNINLIQKQTITKPNNAIMAAEGPITVGGWKWSDIAEKFPGRIISISVPKSSYMVDYPRKGGADIPLSKPMPVDESVNGTIEQCRAICDPDENCGGFVYTKGAGTEVGRCELKDRKKMYPNGLRVTDPTKQLVMKVPNINDSIKDPSCRNSISEPKRVEISYMYGPWIGDDQATEIKFLDDGRHVYMFYDGYYTKMVSEDNQEKYYVGNIAKFNPSDWNTYSNTGGGKYLLRKTGQYKEISRNISVIKYSMIDRAQYDHYSAGPAMSGDSKCDIKGMIPKDGSLQMPNIKPVVQATASVIKETEQKTDEYKRQTQGSPGTSTGAEPFTTLREGLTYIDTMDEVQKNLTKIAKAEYQRERLVAISEESNKVLITESYKFILWSILAILVVLALIKLKETFGQDDADDGDGGGGGLIASILGLFSIGKLDTSDIADKTGDVKNALSSAGSQFKEGAEQLSKNITEGADNMMSSANQAAMGAMEGAQGLADKVNETATDAVNRVGDAVSGEGGDGGGGATTGGKRSHRKK